MQIPILRLGQEYHSADLVELNDSLVTHTANPGLIRRDLLSISESKAALEAIPAETLADYCEAAAELFMHADLPCGDETQGPDDYVDLPPLDIKPKTPEIRFPRPYMRRYNADEMKW